MLFQRVVLTLAISFTASTVIAFENFADYSDVSSNVNQSNELCASTGCFIPVRPFRRGENEIPPSLWALDVSRPNDFCYVSSQDVVLWLPNTNQKGLLSIKNPQTNRGTQFNWPMKKDLIKWPQTRIELTTETNYLVEINGTLSKITMHQIPADLSTTAKINLMKKQGCTGQAGMLESMPRSGDLLTL
jgi:hypothetical protein